MADRTSARVFEWLFTELAKDEPLDKNKLISLLWKHMKKYDFHPCQMECNDALIKLGLASKKDIGDGEYEMVYLNRE